MDTNKCSIILKKIGITPELDGYNYIIKAVEIISNNFNGKILKDIYQPIALDFNKGYRCIERSIRHAIVKVDYDEFESIFGYKPIKKLTNSQLLFLLSEQLQQGEKNNEQN